jgi:hypothetical protein
MLEDKKKRMHFAIEVALIVGFLWLSWKYSGLVNRVDQLKRDVLELENTCRLMGVRFASPGVMVSE